ncbi:hypothetical protein [Alkalibacterium sp. s-m-28]
MTGKLKHTFKKRGIKVNKTSLFMKGWTFAKVEGTDHVKPTSFLPVELPHDWLITESRSLT